MQDVLLIGEVAVETPAPIAELCTRVADALTLGLEEELILVDPRSLEPLPAIEAVLERLPHGRFQRELRAAQIELVTPVCATAAELLREVGAARSQVVAALGARARLLAAGTHPTAQGPAEIADRPRYRGVARDYPWAVRRGLPSGLHIHVGISDPDELSPSTTPRAPTCRSSPRSLRLAFFEGADSALASSRLKLVEDFPRAGTPPAFAGWGEFREFVAWGSTSGLFPDLTYLWWDMRPRPDLGTVEFRVADCGRGPRTPWLWRRSRSRSWPRCGCGGAPANAYGLAHARDRREPVAGRRDGVDTELVDPRNGRREPARDRLARLLLELEPYADELGCDAELSSSGRSSRATARSGSAPWRPPRGFAACCSTWSTRPNARRCLIPPEQIDPRFR